MPRTRAQRQSPRGRVRERISGEQRARAYDEDALINPHGFTPEEGMTFADSALLTAEGAAAGFLLGGPVGAGVGGTLGLVASANPAFTASFKSGQYETAAGVVGLMRKGSFQPGLEDEMTGLLKPMSLRDFEAEYGFTGLKYDENNPLSRAEAELEVQSRMADQVATRLVELDHGGQIAHAVGRMLGSTLADPSFWAGIPASKVVSKFFQAHHANPRMLALTVGVGSGAVNSAFQKELVEATGQREFSTEQMLATIGLTSIVSSAVAWRELGMLARAIDDSPLKSAVRGDIMDSMQTVDIDQVSRAVDDAVGVKPVDIEATGRVSGVKYAQDAEPTAVKPAIVDDVAFDTGDPIHSLILEAADDGRKMQALVDDLTGGVPADMKLPQMALAKAVSSMAEDIKIFARGISKHGSAQPGELVAAVGDFDTLGRAHLRDAIMREVSSELEIRYNSSLVELVDEVDYARAPKGATKRVLEEDGHHVGNSAAATEDAVQDMAAVYREIPEVADQVDETIAKYSEVSEMLRKCVG